MEFDHVGIRAYDVDELAEWYERVLGFKMTNTFSRGYLGGSFQKHTFVEKYGIILDIFSDESDNRKATNKDQRMEHLAFLSDDIKADYDKLKANGADIDEEQSNLTEGKVRNIYCRDIQNNTLHIIQKL